MIYIELSLPYRFIILKMFYFLSAKLTIIFCLYWLYVYFFVSVVEKMFMIRPMLRGG